ncbi:hypothetical protein DID75_02670 [Candidatus Marinamargulisbacteria bacterium SCGC AG-410-N11]|nr:hypothetical protein DID75_02670 [Candidatus Marinamargulisbacteria bacterium SCGC AG-410-N11]
MQHKNKPTISIIGCGWLGEPLAYQFIQDQHKVSGTTTSVDKLDTLKQNGINAHLLSVCADLTPLSLFPGIFDSNITIITIPFKRSLKRAADYFDQICYLTSHLKTDWIIFTSSTSVYPDLPNLTEDITITPSSERQETLLGVENYLTTLPCKFTILRLAGLYGGSRQLGRFLSNKTVTKHPDSPVNLIHLDDVIRLIQYTIERDLSNMIINGVSDSHPSRKTVYSFHSQQLGLPLPRFSTSSPFSNKTVLNQKIKDYGFYFKYPTPVMKDKT